MTVYPPLRRRPGFERVGSMEIFKKLGRVLKVSSRFPGSLGGVVAFPFNEVTEFAVIEAGIKDVFDLPFLVGVNSDRGGEGIFLFLLVSR